MEDKVDSDLVAEVVDLTPVFFTFFQLFRRDLSMACEEEDEFLALAEEAESGTDRSPHEADGWLCVLAFS